MGELHDVLNESHEEVLSNQGEDFIKGIRAVTEEITSDLESQIGISSSIQVPSDFKQLFSNLDFGTQINGNTYHLKLRGDGIKVRHIPVVLNYMASQEKSISIPGYVKPDTIWGFEEPENNLEMRYAFELAKQFKEYSKAIQIFLTTHSPAFYALDQTDSDGVNTYLVSQEADCCTVLKQVTHEDTEHLHDKMGLLPLITPYLREIYEHQQQIELLKSEIGDLAENAKCIVLTEDENFGQLQRYFEIHGFQLPETEFVSYLGASQFNSAIALGNYIFSRNNQAKIIIHRDRDYLTEEEVAGYNRKTAKFGFEFFVTDGVDVESHFISPEHINALYPQITIPDANQIIADATQEVRDLSIKRLVNRFFEMNRGVQDVFTKNQELAELYESDVRRYRYGKKVLKAINAKIQKSIGENVDLATYSEHICLARLSDLAVDVWGGD